MDGDDAVFYSATEGTDIDKTVVGPDDQWRYREVNVSSNFNRTGLDPARSVGNVFDNHGNPVSAPLAAGVAIFNSIINFFANNPINWETLDRAAGAGLAVFRGGGAGLGDEGAAFHRRR